MSLAHATRDNPTAAAHRIGSDDEALETDVYKRQLPSQSL